MELPPPPPPPPPPPLPFPAVESPPPPLPMSPVFDAELPAPPLVPAEIYKGVGPLPCVPGKPTSATMAKCEIDDFRPDPNNTSRNSDNEGGSYVIGRIPAIPELPQLPPAPAPLKPMAPPSFFADATPSSSPPPTPEDASIGNAPVSMEIIGARFGGAPSTPSIRQGLIDATPDDFGAANSGGADPVKVRRRRRRRRKTSPARDSSENNSNLETTTDRNDQVIVDVNNYQKVIVDVNTDVNSNTASD